MKIKSIAMFILAIVLLSVNAIGAAATSNETYELRYMDGQQVLKDNVNNITYLKAFTPDGKEVSLSEYKVLLESSENHSFSNTSPSNADEDLNLNPLVVSTIKYEETQKWTEVMPPRVATPVTDCRNSADKCPIRLEQGITTTEEFSVGVTTMEIPEIRAAASFTWSKSLASTTTIGTDLFVAKGKQGYLTWAPKYTFSKGNLKHYVTLPGGIASVVKEKKGVWGASPVKTATGHADGVIALAIKN
ncbi:hypothetical protein [Paenibacillus assamensis]|uniref:hypothetical protein n=1 Tax=Paenibacillus assamensis TaxID=311244 RepID=UPI0004287552|nr:hypothetical protein [Paenibacillus assamensis]